ncbi:MAG: Rrf2 family transcriptional regulator [Burkholderiales bacterium]|nr:Rrf2 family transcriptional regulator [Burkholderiales bacterium]
MKLQKSTLLALYSMMEFARYPDRQIPATEIADKYGVSAHHLSKVLRELGRAGLLDSLRGVRGGYRFSGNAKRVTLLEVIELFEDIGARPDGPGGEASDTERALASVLSEIDEIAKATFGSITLDVLVKQLEMRRPRAVSTELAALPV